MADKYLTTGTAFVTWPVPLVDSAVLADTARADSDAYRARGAATAVKDVNSKGVTSFAVYPNPTNGTFTVRSSGAGTFTLYTLLGQQMQQYSVTQGASDVQLPAGLAAGMYIGIYKPASGGPAKEIRLMYQP